MRRVTTSMTLGFSLPVAGAWATPADQVRVAQEAERLGYHSLWVLQRLLFPVAPQNDYPRWPATPADQMSPALWERVVAIDLTGTFWGASAPWPSSCPPDGAGS